MKPTWICTLLMLSFTVPAYAQRHGKVAVGISVTSVRPSDEDLDPALGVGFTVARVPKRGWGATGALNWFESDVQGAFVGVAEMIGSIRVRPLMGGVSYTTMPGRTAVSFSIVAGPSLNRMRIADTVRDRVSASSHLDVSLAVRPGVNVSYAFHPRVAITGFGGYLFDRPRFTFGTTAGQVHNTWNADSVVLSVGMAVSLF